MIERNELLQLDENDFLKHCTLDFYKARGPGGQKKNKTESAVRLTHNDSSVAATASEDRKQSVNKSKAIKRLKLELAFTMRCPAVPWKGQMDMNPSNKHYSLFCACLFDHLEENDWQISTVAEAYKLSTNKLIKIISKSDTLWQEVNKRRTSLNHKPLRRSK
ncbi:MAG: peptide chain release factor-like protein [Lentisphaeraceae bacterium]|nr:peptide chain release factor-like protein [Lentisphaeraceae bacterium]